MHGVWICYMPTPVISPTKKRLRVQKNVQKERVAALLWKFVIYLFVYLFLGHTISYEHILHESLHIVKGNDDGRRCIGVQLALLLGGVAINAGAYHHERIIVCHSLRCRCVEKRTKLIFDAAWSLARCN